MAASGSPDPQKPAAPKTTPGNLGETTAPDGSPTPTPKELAETAAPGNLGETKALEKATADSGAAAASASGASASTGKKRASPQLGCA